MNRTEAFIVLGIDPTDDEKTIKNAYRERLAVTNPEDDPQGFKRLRQAYEEACKKEEPSCVEANEEQEDNTASGMWMKSVREVYGDIERRKNVSEWEDLFRADVFMSLEEEENCREKILIFMMNHYRLPSAVWKILDKKLELKKYADKLRERFPADYIRFLVNKCERGEDIDFDKFEGPADADYDLFCQYYDQCWHSLQDGNVTEAKDCVRMADELGIRHPVMELCRSQIFVREGNKDAARKCLESIRALYPDDGLIEYNYAEMLWENFPDEHEASAKIYEALKAENDLHYMSNVRLAEWYYETGKYKEAKKCAETVLRAGTSDEFMGLLEKINLELEKDLEVMSRTNLNEEDGLELCWCYLQDGRITDGIRLAKRVKELLTDKKEAEWFGLMAKLFVEAADYEESIQMTYSWEKALEIKMGTDEEEEERDRDRDRLLQAKMIRMQCFHILGFKDKSYFDKAEEEGKKVLEERPDDIGTMIELSQVYVEKEEYDKCRDLVSELVENYNVLAAYASSLEANRRQLNAGGVVHDASVCMQNFPEFAKAYEYIAKVYLDLDRPEDLKEILRRAKEQNINSPILDAYGYQMTHELMEFDDINKEIKEFRTKYRKAVEEGKKELFEEGLKWLNRLFYNCPDGYMLVERGIYMRIGKRYDEAIADFERAIALRPSNAYALNGLSFVYKFTGDYEKALFFLKKAALYKGDDMSDVIYTDMADLYSLLGDYESALACCEKYLELTKDRAGWLLNQMAEIYVNLGNADKAVELYEEIHKNSPETLCNKLLDVYTKCPNEELGAVALKKWAEIADKADNNSISGKPVSEAKTKGILERLRRIVKPQETDLGPAKGVKNVDFNIGVMWYYMVIGNHEGTALILRQLAENSDLKQPGNLMDCIYAAVLCGEEQLGKAFANRLLHWLAGEKNKNRNEYNNRDRAHLMLEIMANWYSATKEQMEAYFDRLDSCEICHFCTCSVCKEVEGARVLYLLSCGKTDEAKKYMEKNRYKFCSDEYRIAIESMKRGIL